MDQNLKQALAVVIAFQQGEHKNALRVEAKGDDFKRVMNLIPQLSKLFID